MLNQDAAESSLAQCSDYPVDHMEPEIEIEETPEQRERRIEREAFREASLKMIVFMFSAVNYIHEARSPSEMAIRLWAVSSAIDHPAIAGRSDSEIASRLGTTRANFSKHVLTFEKQNSLPPTLSQKSVDARAKYSAARKAQLNGN